MPGTHKILKGYLFQQENKNNKELPDISIGQKVYGKHKNGRYYASIVKSETLQNFHHVVFTDKSWSDNLYEQDITVSY